MDNRHSILNKLRAIKVAINTTDDFSRKKGYYILQLNYEEQTLVVLYYKPSEVDRATENYRLFEGNKTNQHVDTVLVSALSFDAIRQGYPNYFSDISKFIRKVEWLVYGY